MNYEPVYSNAVRWIRLGLLLVTGSSFVAFLLISRLQDVAPMQAFLGCCLVLLTAWAKPERP